MSLEKLISLWVGKTFVFAIRMLSSGSGSTWPGHVALRLYPKFVKNTLHKSRVEVILVIGTNGKTTTSSLIAHLLEKSGKRVFANREGANLLNGIASSVLRHTTFSGNLPYDFAVFEVDENNFPAVLQNTSPDVVVALNLFRDQLDRYGEVNTIAQKWREALGQHAKTTLVLNTDDPLVRYLGYKSKHDALYFDIPKTHYRKQALSHDVDSIFCPVSGDELSFSQLTFSHLGKYRCKKCGYTNEKAKNVSLKNPPIDGLYNLYNLNASLRTVSVLLQEDASGLVPLLNDFEPSFGRGESIKYKDRHFVMLLSKNPAGFNQSIARVLDSFRQSPNSKTVILALNDRVPDGRDVSWIWDVGTEELMRKKTALTITGDRAYDMALRIQYSQSIEIRNSKFEIEEDFQKSINNAVHQTKKGEKIYVLPTYTAMLEMRKLLTGRKLM